MLTLLRLDKGKRYWQSHAWVKVCTNFVVCLWSVGGRDAGLGNRGCGGRRKRTATLRYLIRASAGQRHFLLSFLLSSITMAPLETEYYDLVRYMIHSCSTFSALSCSSSTSPLMLATPSSRRRIENKQSRCVGQLRSTCSTTEVACAQFHPDKNSSPEAEEKFKEIRSDRAFCPVFST